jgi:3-deoxy-7-phosphoheptulonate synthase
MKDISSHDLTNNFPLAARSAGQERSVIRVGNVEFGGERVVVIAGPCAVENREQVLDMVAGYADVLQIGARNMQNFPLLEEVARVGKPVLLKRHFGCSLRDWLGAAEYVLHGGNPDVILCERGIVAPHTHQPTSRFIVDLQAVLAAQEFTHLPVIVDPSHSTFRREYVAPIARAAIAAGADGIIMDVHPTPEQAAVDPLQALNYEAFGKLTEELRGIAAVIGREA